jgi:hypothetical protein
LHEIVDGQAHVPVPACDRADHAELRSDDAVPRRLLAALCGAKELRILIVRHRASPRLERSGVYVGGHQQFAADSMRQLRSAERHGVE